MHSTKSDRITLKDYFKLHLEPCDLSQLSLHSKSRSTTNFYCFILFVLILSDLKFNSNYKVFNCDY